MAIGKSIFDASNKRISRKVFDNVLARVAERIIKRLEATAPVSTGRSGPLRRGEILGHPDSGKHLRDTFSYRVVGGEIIIVSDAPHFLPITEGSKPHKIVGSPWLYFPVKEKSRKLRGGSRSGKKTTSRKPTITGGEAQFMIAVNKPVNHRGHKKNPFFDNVKREIPKILREELNRVTGK